MKRRQKIRSQAAFTLVEMAMAVFVFGMILILFGATFPVATRASKVGASYTQAAQIAQHKLDQCRQAGYSLWTGSAGDLSLMQSAQIVDSVQPAGFPIVNPAGFPTPAVSYSFTLADDLVDNGSAVGFFPEGSVGILTLSPLPSAGWTPPGAGTGAGQAIMATVTVRWTGSPQGAGVVVARTILANR